MSDRIETGPGQVERDGAALQYVSGGGMLRDLGLATDGKRGPEGMAAPELAASVVRAILRRIEGLGDSLRGHDSAIRGLREWSKVDKAETEKAIRKLDRSIDAHLDEIDARLDMLDRRTARVQQYDERGYPIPPAPSSPELEERRGRASADFLTPPPIARAIGRVVLRAADEIRAEGAATLGARLSNILGTLGRSEADRAHYHLVQAIADAKRAGVIP